MKIFKAGLIGCGFFSQHHLEAWRRMANVQIMAACDYQIERAQTAARAPTPLLRRCWKLKNWILSIS